MKLNMLHLDNRERKRFYMRTKQSICSRRRISLINRATKEELIIKQKLEDSGIKFIFQKGFIAGNNFCIADFYIPRPYRIVIEIDGEYHKSVSQLKRDKQKDLYYKSRGFKIIRMLNKDVYSFSISSLF
jgi:very-short-patch-repair endonuclease